MKKTSLFFIILLVFSSYKQTTQQKAQTPDKTLSKDKSNFSPEQEIDINQLSNLTPIDTVDSKKNNVFEKYGIEFTGNCYDCDLAKILIKNNLLKLTNVCDPKISKQYPILKITSTKNNIILKTAKHEFIFSKIDKAPVFTLKSSSNFVAPENLRISPYYTLPKLLPKFAQHDCGGFDG